VKRLEKNIVKVSSSEVKPVVLKEEDKLNFEKATKCWICEQDFEVGEKKSKRPLSLLWTFQM